RQLSDLRDLEGKMVEADNQLKDDLLAKTNEMKKLETKALAADKELAAKKKASNDSLDSKLHDLEKAQSDSIKAGMDMQVKIRKEQTTRFRDCIKMKRDTENELRMHPTVQHGANHARTSSKDRKAALDDIFSDCMYGEEAQRLDDDATSE